MKVHDAVSKKPAQIAQQPGKSRFKIEKLEERIAPDCKFNPNAGPWSTTPCYGGYACYTSRIKVGKYVGKC